jgi:ubiquinone/menaquinone biosynthesis C-methylase UbiE
MEEEQVKVVDDWNQVAPSGDESDRRYFKTIRYISNLSKNSLIIDLGCGQGRNLELLHNLGFNELIGMDISITQLRIAKEKVRAASFIVADATRLPFQDQIFDATSSTAVIEHLRDPSEFLSEVNRITKTFGHAVISSDCYIWKFLFFFGVCKTTQPIDNPVSPSKLLNLFKQNGFVVLHYDAWAQNLWFRKLFLRTFLFILSPVTKKLQLRRIMRRKN